MPEGGRGSCAGFSVALSADTPATRERMRILYGSTDHALAPVALVKRRAAGAPRETANPLAGTALCDARGDFAFSGLPAGAYFLIARVKINPPRDGSASFVTMRRLELTSGEADITLAP